MKRNLKKIFFLNSLFFSSYFILKAPLALVLSEKGWEIHQAYSLVTLAALFFATYSLVYSFLFRNIKSQKEILLIGQSLILLAITLLHFFNSSLVIKLGLAFYIVGGSLYFFNITLFVNKQFLTNSERLQGNYQYQVFLNIGAFLGALMFVIGNQYMSNDFLFSQIAIVLSILVFIGFYRDIEPVTSDKDSVWRLVMPIVALLILVFVSLNYPVYSRPLIFIAFLAMVVGFWWKLRQGEEDDSLAHFIKLILLCSVPYWVCNIILYSQFFYFLDDDVNKIYMLSAMFIFLLDPLINILFGSGWAKINKRYNFNIHYNLISATCLLFIVFLILFLGVYLAKGKVSPIYPILAMVIFSSGQFLVQTNLNAGVRNLIGSQQSQLMGLGMLRSARAMASLISFGIINLSFKFSVISHHQHHPYYYLYGLMSVFMLCIIFCYWKFIFSKRHLFS